MLASITGQKAALLQLCAQLRIELDECAGDAEASRTSLTADAAPIRKDQDVEAIRQFGEQQRLTNIGASGFVRKIVLKRAMVNGDLAFSGAQKDTRGRSLAAAGS